MGQVVAVSDDGVAALGTDTEAGRRIARMRDFFAFVQTELGDLLAKWRADNPLCEAGRADGTTVSWRRRTTVAPCAESADSADPGDSCRRLAVRRWITWPVELPTLGADGFRS